MKKIIVAPLLLFVLSLSLTSCKKDVEDRLPGDWKLTSTETTTLPTPDSDVDVGTITFNEDGTGTITVEEETSAFVWSSTDEKVSITVDETLLFDIIVNESKLQQWEYTYPETVIVEENGVEYESPLVIEIKLEKE